MYKNENIECIYKTSITIIMITTMKIMLEDGTIEFFGELSTKIWCSSDTIRNYMSNFRTDTIDLTMIKITKKEIYTWIEGLEQYIKINKKTYVLMMNKNMETQNFSVTHGMDKINEYLCGYDYTLTLIKNIINTNDKEIFIMMYNYIDKTELCSILICANKVEWLIYAHENGCEFDENVGKYASELGCN